MVVGYLVEYCLYIDYEEIEVVLLGGEIVFLCSLIYIVVDLGYGLLYFDVMLSLCVIL